MSIILASGSGARREILRDAGISFTAIPADIDEPAVIAKGLERGESIQGITQELAAAKALHISRAHPEALVIGSDQTLEFEDVILNKAKTTDEAADKLRALCGNTHILRSAVCVALKGEVVFGECDDAHLTMIDFDDEFLRAYLTKDPDALTSCVGGYKIEGEGANLFSDVDGDKHTIMGMPSKQLIAFLRENDSITP